ncbi:MULTISPECIES: hypothetical protein [Rhodopseudomonas]|jgi:hypothetical protein|nr:MULTISPECIES: hypothetical protein [Rhodopseudomonas]
MIGLRLEISIVAPWVRRFASAICAQSLLRDAAAREPAAPRTGVE